MAKRNPAAEAKRSELIVLYLLMEVARSGYQIRALIRDWEIDRYLPVSPTTIYRTLERLAEQGFLGGATLKNGRFPISTMYTISAKGKRHYRKLIMEEACFSRSGYSLTTFLGLAHYLTQPECETLARVWQRAARERIKELDSRINDRTRGIGHTYGKTFAEWILLDHERDMLGAEVLWLDKYIGFRQGWNDPRAAVPLASAKANA